MTAELESVTVEDVPFYHRELSVVSGGVGGVRDRGPLESALARPRTVLAGSATDLAELAAAYAHSLVKHQAFTTWIRARSK